LWLFSKWKFRNLRKLYPQWLDFFDINWDKEFIFKFENLDVNEAFDAFDMKMKQLIDQNLPSYAARVTKKTNEYLQNAIDYDRYS